MIDEKYALAVLKSVDYRKVKYNIIDERIKELKLHDEVIPTLNAIRRDDLINKLVDSKDNSLQDYINYHEYCLKQLEEDMKKVSSAIDTISKVDNDYAIILYMIYFQHKTKTEVASYLRVDKMKVYAKFKEAVKMFAKVY